MSLNRFQFRIRPQSQSDPRFLPIVGSPAAAVYSYRRFTMLGVAGTVAGWALVVSGIYSSLALATITALGGVFSANFSASVAGASAIALGVLPLGVGVLSLQYRGVRRLAERTGIWATAVLAAVIRRRHHSKIAAVRSVQKVAALRLSNGGSAVVAGLSALNWLLDLACLACAMLALDGDVPWHKLVLVWAAGVGASALHLTPGGLGVVEAALTLALVGAGTPAAAAVAVVILYRAISFWLVLAAGAAVLCTRIGQRRPRRHTAVELRPCQRRTPATLQGAPEPFSSHCELLPSSTVSRCQWPSTTPAATSRPARGSSSALVRGTAPALPD